MSEIIKKDATDLLEEYNLDYSSYVGQERAIPNVVDGLKPVHLRILYSMYMNKNTKFTKSQQIAGNTMALHPHGDSYQTMVGMTQTDNNLIPLVIGKGAFSSPTSRDLVAASSRYTEAKMSDFVIESIKYLSKADEAYWTKNFDGTIRVPKSIPFDLPMALLRPQSGIAYGLAASIPSFNPGEVVQAIVDYLSSGNKTVLVPDFPTGGMVANDGVAFRSIVETGTGTITMYPKAEFVGNSIMISEIPYTTTREQIIEAILKKIQLKEITEIKGIHDLTGLNGLSIEIELKRGVDPAAFYESLIAQKILSSTFSANMNFLGLDGKPALFGVYDVIDNWLQYRRNFIRMELNKRKEELIQNGRNLAALEAVKDKLDEYFIPLVRFTKKTDACDKLCADLSLSSEQAKFLLALPLTAMNVEEIERRMEELDSMRKEVVEIVAAIESTTRVDEIIIERMQEAVKKYAEDRKTQVAAPVAVVSRGARKTNSKVAPVDSRGVLTEQGFFIKLPANSTAEPKLAPGDKVLFDMHCKPGAYIVTFSDGNVAKTYVDDIAFAKPSDLGVFISSDKCILATDEVKYLLFLFENGKILKLDKSAYNTGTKRKLLKNAYNTASTLLQVLPLADDVELAGMRANGAVQQILTSEIRTSTGKTGGGAWYKAKKDILAIS